MLCEKSGIEGIFEGESTICPDWFWINSLLTCPGKGLTSVPWSAIKISDFPSLLKSPTVKSLGCTTKFEPTNGFVDEKFKEPLFW